MCQTWETTKKRVYDNSDCGDLAIRHWLLIMNTLFDDLPSLRHSAVFHFEHFALGDPQGAC